MSDEKESEIESTLLLLSKHGRGLIYLSLSLSLIPELFFGLKHQNYCSRFPFTPFTFMFFNNTFLQRYNSTQQLQLEQCSSLTDTGDNGYKDVSI